MLQGWNKTVLNPEWHWFDDKGRSLCGKYLSTKDGVTQQMPYIGRCCSLCVKKVEEGDFSWKGFSKDEN